MADSKYDKNFYNNNKQRNIHFNNPYDDMANSSPRYNLFSNANRQRMGTPMPSCSISNNNTFLPFSDRYRPSFNNHQQFFFRDSQKSPANPSLKKNTYQQAHGYRFEDSNVKNKVLFLCFLLKIFNLSNFIGFNSIQ